MKLVPYDRKKLGYITYTKTKNFKILTEFIDSGMECAKVEGWSNKYAHYCSSSLQQSIKWFKMNNVRAITRNGEVFLIRTDE